MNGTGGTVFKICGGINFTFGPAEGMIVVTGLTGNVMDVGPCNSNVSMDNFVIRNIDVESNVPGDYVQVITNNYTGTQNPAPYILNGRFENFRNLSSVGVGITGYPIRINSNTVGPEVNVNGLIFLNMALNENSTNTKSLIHIQSSLSSSSGSAINFQVHSGYLNFASASTAAVVDVDSATTAGNVSGVTLNSPYIFGGIAYTPPFSPTLLANVPQSSALISLGWPNQQLGAIVSLSAGGPAAGLTGTGACGTITTKSGGSWAGTAKCTGTTGASTFIITPGTTARNGWACSASDITTANALRQSAVGATSCTISGTVNANDVLTFSAVAY